MVHFRRSALLAVVVLLGWPASTALPQAPTEALVTDRPDITESSEVVGGGWFQVETSLQGRRFETGTLETETWNPGFTIHLQKGKTHEIPMACDFLNRE